MQIIQTDPPKIRHNIVFFGATGAGKSSIINLLQAADVADVSSSASGCTLSSTGYAGTIGGQAYTFWDTAGLNEGDIGRVPDLKAVIALHHLLRGLEGGVSLLVFCMKAPRITEAGRKNWDLFSNLFCRGLVPVVLAITHLEQEDMDKWWCENELLFSRNEINPSRVVYRQYHGKPNTGSSSCSNAGVACITASRGKLRATGQYALEEEYEQSHWKMKKLVFESHLPKPWKVGPVQWFQEITREVRAGHWLCPKIESVKDYVPGQGIFGLMDRWGLKAEEAVVIAQALEADTADSVETRGSSL